MTNSAAVKTPGSETTVHRLEGHRSRRASLTMVGMGVVGGLGQGRSLVEEIHEQRARAEVERRIHRRRRRRRRVVGLFGALGLATLSTLAGVELVQRYRIEQRIGVAEQELSVSSPAALNRATDVLDRNLSVEPEHAETLGLLAFVRVHQYAEGLVDVSRAQAAIDDASRVDEMGASLAAGILAGLQGDFDTARRTYEAQLGDVPERSSDERTVAHNEAAWLRALTALGRPYETDRVHDALVRVQAVLEAEPTWVPNRRAAAALLVRQGQFDRALEVLAAGREREPGHLGLAVDEAIVHATMLDELEGVEQVARDILDHPDATATDRAYARLALGLARLHEDEAGALDDLEQGWEALPDWDNHSRDLALCAVLAAGEVEQARRWLEQSKLGPLGDELLGAWLDLVKGDAPRALQRLAELPQDHPRVARLQALALVEQGRWGEARQWLEYGRNQGLEHPDLDVAAARLQLRGDDAAAALQTLEALAKAHPRTHRVWTGLAEARRETEAEPEAVDEAIEHALEHEPAPAEASWVQGESLRVAAVENPERAEKALAAYRKATDLAPAIDRYAVELGLFQAELGMLEQARQTLHPLLEKEAIDPRALLTCAQMDVEQAWLGGTAVPEAVRGWLERAGQLGADGWDLELEWARFDLAHRDPASTERARARAAKVVEARPKSIEARVVHARALVAQENYGGARATLRQGIRRTLRTIDGRLYVTLAEVELARGKKRAAASLAFKGWRKMVRQPATGAELMAAAPFVSQLWKNLDQPRGAVTVGRELTERLPFSVQAWVLRGENQFLGDHAREGCESAERAMAMAPENPAAIALHGDCLTRRYDFEGARKAYEQAVALSEGTPEQRVYARKLRRL